MEKNDEPSAALVLGRIRWLHIYEDLPDLIEIETRVEVCAWREMATSYASPSVLSENARMLAGGHGSQWANSHLSAAPIPVLDGSNFVSIQLMRQVMSFAILRWRQVLPVNDQSQSRDSQLKCQQNWE